MAEYLWLLPETWPQDSDPVSGGSGVEESVLIDARTGEVMVDMPMH